MTSNSRKRSHRAVANDTAIRDAAVNEILRVGIDRMSLRDVAKRAGLTHGATYARYEDVNELLIDLWQSQLCDSAVELFEQCVGTVAAPSEKTVGALFDRVRETRARDVAMIEVLLVARRMPILNEEIVPFTEKYLRPQQLTTLAKILFTRSVSLFAIIMENIARESQYGSDVGYLGVAERVLLAALKADPTATQARESLEFDDLRRSQPDDSLRAQLNYATYVVVAQSGFHDATISRIARRADCSPGAIYKLYDSKEDLVADSFRTGPRWLNDSDFARILGADTVAKLFAYEATSQNDVRRRFAAEVFIAGAHNEKLQVTVGRSMRDPGGIVTRLVIDDDAKRECIGQMICFIASASRGVRWLSIITNSTESLDLNEFAHHFRCGLVSEWRAVGARRHA